VEIFFLIILLMSLGYLFNKFSIFPKETPNVLNLFIIYISLPAMVLLYIPQIEITKDIFSLVFIPFVVTFLGASTIIVLSKFFSWGKKTVGVLLLVGVLGNTSFLGIPIVEYYLGTKALPYVIIYDQLGTFLLLNTYGAIVIAVYSNDDKINKKIIIKKIFTFPPFVALIVAFMFHDLGFDEKALNILNILANTLVPVALISVGYSLQLKIPREDLSAFFVALLTKLIFIPIFAFLVVSMLKIDGLVRDVSILESAMAPMITAGALASMAGFSSRLSSSIVAYGILISFATTAIVFHYL
jgi:predicted permease